MCVGETRRLASWLCRCSVGFSCSVADFWVRLFCFLFFAFGGVDGTTHLYFGDAGWTMCVAGVRFISR
jgi:hypothetical protein